MAVLFSYDPETGESTADPLVGMHPNGNDPITWAYALKENIIDDFPGRIWSITGNDSARELRKELLIQSLLGPRSPKEPIA